MKFCTAVQCYTASNNCTQFCLSPIVTVIAGISCLRHHFCFICLTEAAIVNVAYLSCLSGTVLTIIHEEWDRTGMGRQAGKKDGEEETSD